jgi:dethiobiotin synthetase
LFVTGTGTDIGKTHVTAGLLRALRARGIGAAAIKPVVSGFDWSDAATSDPGRLLTAMGEAPTPDAIATISPFRFRAPLSPDMAAFAEGRNLRLEDIVAFCRGCIETAAGPLLIEGVGGVMSPVAEDATCLDLARALDAPILLVTGTYLGAISHALTAGAALRGRDLRHIVVNESSEGSVGLDRTIASLKRFASDVAISASPRGAARDAFDSLVDELGLVAGARGG